MIHLDYRDSRPIYEQVKDGLRHLMVTGALGAGDKLPSVRALAGELAINPNTIQRAAASWPSPAGSTTRARRSCCKRPGPFWRS